MTSQVVFGFLGVNFFTSIPIGIFAGFFLGFGVVLACFFGEKRFSNVLVPPPSISASLLGTSFSA